MTERLEVLYSLIGSGKTFADVGCDHGYISKAVIDNNKFEKVILSDVSEKSLEKAKELLSQYGDKVEFIACDGFLGYTTTPDEAIIAGMGGEEIIKILSESKMPESLVLAPQKNTEKVRKFLLENGYRLEKDFTFYTAGKFYDAILAKIGSDEYSPMEVIFGRDNLKQKPQAFIKKIQAEIDLLNGVVESDASQLNKERAKLRLAILKGILK